MAESEAFPAKDALDEDVDFLTVEQVRILHEESIRLFSPGESLAVRDERLLESAVMTPQQTWDGQFLYPTSSAMAAAYLVRLAQNHPFENGNKCVAFATTSTFLSMNGSS